MADTGATYPGTAASQSVSPEDDCVWTNPNNIKADDGTNASAYLGLPTVAYTDRLKATNFGFSLPAGATVVGIKVEIERYVGYSNTWKDYRVQLLGSSGNLVGNNKKSSSYWPVSPQKATYGGSTDTWGASPTEAMVESNNFGVVLSVEIKAGYTDTAFVDYIRMTIYYTTGWQGKVSGVTNPAKVMGVSAVNIASIKGVS